MNLFYRISVYTVLCGAVACGKTDADIVVPTWEPETVMIGCAGAGADADIEVRTQIDDDLSVRWVSGDEVRLWAREHGASAFLSEVRNIPFRFDYYSPKWSRAGFTGTINGVSNVFDADKRYDYYAVSPAPAAESDVDGTWVSYTVPDVQDGVFDGRYDILTARLEQLPALQKGDNNPAVNLKFGHHLHAMKFSIPRNALGEKISAVELTFPRPVVGRLAVDMTGESPDDLSGIDCNKLTIEFPKGAEKDAGDTFFAMVAPIAFASGEQIGMRIIGSTGETSVDYTFARPTSFAAEHLTPVLLHVPAKNTFYTVLEFSVADNLRPEFSGQPNRMGENTLGERLQFVRLKGDAGAFANAVRMTRGCSVSVDGSVLECAVSDDSDGIYTLSFVSEKLAGSKCPYEKWDYSAVSGRQVEVEYESASAHIRTIEGYSSMQTALPAIDPAQTAPYSTVLPEIPYLFEEDFSRIDGLDINGTNSKTEQSGSKLEDKYFLYSGWTGNQVAGYLNEETNGIEIKTRTESTSKNAVGIYTGRLDSAPIKALKTGADATVYVNFAYYHYSGSSAAFTRKMNYGTTTDPEPIEAYKYVKALIFGTTEEGNHVEGYSTPLMVDQGGDISDWEIKNCTNQTRLSWEMSITDNPGNTGNHNHLLRIGNLKVSFRPLKKMVRNDKNRAKIDKKYTTMTRVFLKYIVWGLTAAFLVGCSDNGTGGETDAARCRGSLAIKGLTSAAVVSRAEIDLATVCTGLKVPASNELKLTLTGKDISELEATETGELVPVSQFDYSGEWATLADYDEPDLYPGTYTATLGYGDPLAIGPDKPYYKGEVQAEVEIAEKNTCRVGVKICNSVVRVTATEQFRNYFSDARFRLVVDGKELEDVSFTFGAEDRPVFVPAGAKVGVKGSVRRPSQDSKDDAQGEQLDIEVPARTMAAGTLHTFAFTAQAGGAKVEVVFLDHEEGGSDDVELNDDAVK